MDFLIGLMSSWVEMVEQNNSALSNQVLDNYLIQFKRNKRIAIHIL
jgi:hypothetical protein